MEGVPRADERRSAARLAAKYFLRVWLGHDEQPAGSLKETSSTGFRLFSTREVRPGDMIEFRCDSPASDGAFIRGSARCVWSRCRYKDRIWDVGFAIEGADVIGWAELTAMSAVARAQAA